MSLRQINLELGDSLIVVLSISTSLETQIKNSSRLLREPSKTFCKYGISCCRVERVLFFFPLLSVAGKAKSLKGRGSGKKVSSTDILKIAFAFVPSSCNLNFLCLSLSHLRGKSWSSTAKKCISLPKMQIPSRYIQRRRSK